MRRHKPDVMMLMLIIVLLMLGLVVIYSIGPALATKRGLDQNHFMYRQILYLVIAGIAFAIAATRPIRWWAKVQNIAVIAAVVGCLALFIPGLGSEVYGATRWIDIGPISFQPAELVKFALVLYLARFFTERITTGTINDRTQTLYPFGIVLAIVGLFVGVLQKDLGTMITIVILMLTMLYYAGISWRSTALLSLVLAGGAILMVIIFPHRLSRITTFLHPEHDTDGSSYQITQALIAVGSGGVTGVGIGQSVQAYGYLPEAANDSIFAIMAEKLGFIGTSVVIMIFGALLWRIMRIVKYASSTYSQLLAAGILGWMMAHILVNISAIIGLIPLTGITLPFISFGGTSLVMIMACLGIVYQISHYTYHELPNVKEENDTHSSGRGWLGRSRHTTGRRGWSARSAIR